MSTNRDAALGLLGDPTRRAIFELLAQGPLSVGELAERLPISRPAVSQHLRMLKTGGLVISEPAGARRIYRLDPDGVSALRAYVDHVTLSGPAARPDPTGTGNREAVAPAFPSVRGTVTVGASTDRAFHVLTSSIDAWWPHQFHVGQAEMAEAILEPWAGGRWYERGEDGSERDWGRVLVWEPPHRLVLTWQINGQWQYDPDPEHASKVELRFIATGPEQTTVELEHRHIHRHVSGQAVSA